MFSKRCRKALNFKGIATATETAIHQVAVSYLYLRLWLTAPLILLIVSSFFSRWALTFGPAYFIWDRVSAPVFARSARYFFMRLAASWTIGRPVALLLTWAMMACRTMLVRVWDTAKLARCLNDKPDAGLLVIPVCWQPSGSGV